MQHGLITGKGIMKFASHPQFEAYDGMWVNGAFEGWGILRLSNGEEYRGSWRSGEREGHGFHSFSKTSPFSYYRGEWSKDEFNGVGCLAL